MSDRISDCDVLVRNAESEIFSISHQTDKQIDTQTEKRIKNSVLVILGWVTNYPNAQYLKNSHFICLFKIMQICQGSMEISCLCSTLY